MKFPFILLFLFVFISKVSSAAIKDGQFSKRDTPSGSLFSELLSGLFGSSSGTSSPAPAAPSPVESPTATPAAAPASSSGSSRGVLGGLFGGLFDWLNDDGPSSAPPAPAASSPTTTAPPVSSPVVPTSTLITSSPVEGSDDDGFDLFDTLFGRTSRRTTSAGGFTTASPSTVLSSQVPTFTSSSSSTGYSYPTGDDGDDNGGDEDYSEVEKYAAMGAGISYSPYTTKGECKSLQQVKNDMNTLSAFRIIRLYGVDCSGVENVLASMSSNQELFVGIYNIDDYNINQDLSILKKAVEGSSRGWPAVHTVSIGNELVNAGLANAGQIVNALKSARSWFKSNASEYSGAIVSVDTLVAVKNNPSLCDASDYIAVNCHPFWDGGVLPSDSGQWLQQQISELESICNNNKKIFITESGWPTQGDTFGNCVPSKSNQLAAVKSIGEALGEDVLMFTTFNDYWKNPGPSNVEQHWGIFGEPSA